MTLFLQSLLIALVSSSGVSVAPQESRPVSTEARTYIESLGNLGDHGRPPEQTRLDFSAVCNTRHYRIALRRDLNAAHEGRLELEALEQPGRDPSADDRGQVQAVLDGFDEASTISLHCWETAGYRYLISGSSRSDDGTWKETTVAIFFDGSGRLDRVVR